MENGSDATFLREMIGFAAQRLMEPETEGVCGAAHGERSEDRRNHRIVAVAVIVAVGVDTDGRREVLGMTTGDSEAELCSGRSSCAACAIAVGAAANG